MASSNQRLIELSNNAESDLNEIFDYTEMEYGFARP